MSSKDALTLNVALRRRLLRETHHLLDRLRGAVVSDTAPADVLAVFRRHPRYIRGSKVYSEAGPYLPDHWDLPRVLNIFPEDVPLLRIEKAGPGNHREEVRDLLDALALENDDMLIIVRELDTLYYQVVDDRLRPRYESMLRTPVWKKELETLHRRRGGMRTKPGRVSKVTLEVVDEMIDDFEDPFAGLTEVLDAASDLGLVGGFTAEYEWTTKGGKDRQRVTRPRRLGRAQDLPAFTSFSVKVDAILKRAEWQPVDRDNMIDEMLAVVFGDWYGLPTPRSRRVSKRVDRERARRTRQEHDRRQRLHGRPSRNRKTPTKTKH